MKMTFICGGDFASNDAQLSTIPVLAALIQNPLPDAVDGPLELGACCGSDLVKVWFGCAAHNQQVLFRHTAHNRIGVE
jgi:hypothetical protein